MKTIIASALVATGLIAGAPIAAAQSNTMMAEPQAATDVSDAEVESFAAAAGEMQALPDDSSTDAAAKQQQMLAILKKHNMKPERFNAIGKALQTDKDLQTRVGTAMQAQPGGPE
ncbi:DUF4168 domain-containing protein [Stakelama sp. CBK3Z-3]|uniref:DUF4168 domain-containing protein n=1 Tax=Stakelama flava TaxID=2860338 RepID=A0ABS6XH83_9SPHN|nr:DUF4168 domain-containing protein [Stakelama flava]MBW4329582.1 DUF4168 domain-containing protein [Stakelama flava]